MAYERGSASGYGVHLTCFDNENNLLLSSKRSKVLEEEDMLSSLPDSMLLHILSFLNLKDAVRTGALSRRWQFLWTDLSEFDFLDHNLEIEKIRGFVEWVGKTLVLCSDTHLKKFWVYFDYKYCFASSVDVWVQFLVKYKVKDVALHLYSRNGDFYKLPQVLYSNSSLTNLSLLKCIIAPLGTIEWKSLTSLSIAKVELCDSVMGNILSGCPVLEFLKLDMCWGSRDVFLVDIKTQSLKELVIHSWKFYEARLLLKIFAPYIQHLSITGTFVGDCQFFRLIGISSLVRANLSFHTASNWRLRESVASERTKNHLKNLFESLQHVEELELETWFFEAVSVMKVKGWKLPEYSCKCLTLKASLHGRSMPGILYMLESCPNLETLVINGSFPPYEVCLTRKQVASYLQDDLNCDLLQLKTVKFANFRGTYLDGELMMLKLVQVLLKSAVVLEKMVINVTKSTVIPSHAISSSDYIKIADTLLSYPRSSPKAVQLC